MHIAGVAFVAGAGNADDGLAQVVVGEADGVQHRLGGGLGIVLGDVFAVFVDAHRLPVVVEGTGIITAENAGCKRRDGGACAR